METKEGKWNCRKTCATKCRTNKETQNSSPVRNSAYTITSPKRNPHIYTYHSNARTTNARTWSTRLQTWRSHKQPPASSSQYPQKHCIPSVATSSLPSSPIAFAPHSPSQTHPAVSQPSSSAFSNCDDSSSSTFCFQGDTQSSELPCEQTMKANLSRVGTSMLPFILKDIISRTWDPTSFWANAPSHLRISNSHQRQRITSITSQLPCEKKSYGIQSTLAECGAYSPRLAWTFFLSGTKQQHLE